MSEQNHTPEPWSYQASIPEDGFECFFINGKSKRISDFDGPQDEEQFANVRRIIYCVNALEGLSDHALIGGWTFRGIEAFAKGLEKQRDELLAALGKMNLAYVRLMESGRDRIRDLGGECVGIEAMEQADPYLRE